MITDTFSVLPGMMAVGHALSGLCAGLSVGALAHGQLALVSVGQTMAISGAQSGAAVVNDIDHHGSTATTSLGKVSFWVHERTVDLHYLVCRMLRSPTDKRKPPGAHRGITHWWPFPILVGLATGIATALSAWAVWVVLSLLFMLALRALSVPEYRDNQRGSKWAQLRRRAAHGAVSASPTIWVLRRLRRLLRHRRVAHAGRVVFGAIVIGVMYWLHGTVGGFLPLWAEAALYLVVLGVATGILASGGTPMLARLGVLGAASLLAALAVLKGGAADLGWLWGVVVWAGMQLHIEGDRPTESGIPGFKLTTIKRWPKKLAFKAGGAFEMLAMWLPMSGYAAFMIFTTL